MTRLEVGGHIARRSGDNRSGPPSSKASEHLSGPRASRFPWSLTIRIARIAHPVEFDDVANSARFRVSVGGGSGTGAGAPTSAATTEAEDPTENMGEGQGDDHAGEASCDNPDDNKQRAAVRHGEEAVLDQNTRKYGDD